MPDGPGGGEIPTPGVPKKPDRVTQAPGKMPKAPNLIPNVRVDVSEDNLLQGQAVPETGAKTRIDPERIEAVRKEWERSNLGRTLSLAERRTQEMLIEKGVYPGGGGATRLNVLDYPDARLQNIVTELNTEIIRGGDGNPLSSGYIQEQLIRIRNLLDQGSVDQVQANSLLANLNAWMAEAQKTEGDKSAYRYFSRKEEEQILTNDAERERIFEEIFVGVDANPGSPFQLSLEASAKLDYFFTALNNVRVFDDAGIEITDAAVVTKRRGQLFQEFSGKREIRRILHDANYSVSGGGDIQAFAQSMATFQSEYVDLIFQDPLVATALRMFEQAFQQIKADNNGMLPYEELAWNYKEDKGKGSSKLEDKVERLMRNEMLMGVTPNVPEWRLRRAIILARGFGVASLRFPEIAAQARLPEETTFANATERASRFGSIYGEAIARYLDPLEHLIEKFAIGGEDRALLYYFLTGDNKHIESKEQLDKALKMASHLTGKDKRLIDVINIFRIGGGFSQSSWRTFMSMRDFTEEQRRRSGIGILEGRVSGDVEDDIREAVKQDFAGRSEEEMAKEVKKRIGKDKTEMMLEKRMAMWKDALKANPLRVMWQWEEKEPGKRVKFLREALGGISEAEAKTFLPEVEQDLMVIQENTVRRLGLPEDDPNRITYDEPEMLKFDIIVGPNPSPEDILRRERVEKYVKKIRDEAVRAGPRYRGPKGEDRSFIQSLFDKSDAQGSPFPFVIGFEDIPFSDFNFINTGGRGFARRINDYANSVTAANELMGLITKIPRVHDIGPLIDSLDKIKQAVAQYDKSIAMEVVPYLARGIIRMYDKDLISRMPLGIGTVTGMLHNSSFAQTQYGRAAMAWDEGDKFNFTTQLLHNGLISKKDLAGLRKDVGATPANLTIDILRTYGQLALLLLLYGFAKSVASDK